MAFTTPLATLTEGLGFFGGTSSAIDTTGANLLVVAYSHVAGATPTLSDSKGNTWSSVAVSVGGADWDLRLYYSVPSSVGSGHTFTVAAGGAEVQASVSVQAWAGAATTPLDQTNNNYAGTGSDTSVQPGSVTPSEANELVVTALENRFDSSDSSRSINSGFTISGQSGNHDNSASLALAYLVQTSAAAVNPTWSWSSGGTANAVIGTFKASAAATSPARIIFEHA